MASADDPSDDDAGDLIDILLIEPNHGDVRLFEESFKDGKILNDIHSVSDGESALEFIRQRGEYEAAPRPDLILLEPQLPGKSGIEVLSELNDEPALREIPVIVLTSSESAEDVVRSYDLDADDYMQKPVEADEFVEFVQSVEDFWLAIVQSQ